MSALIKAGSRSRPAGGFSSLSLRDIGREAEAVLAEARARSEEIVKAAVAQAERDRASIREQARQEGYADGLGEGRRVGHEAALAEARERFASDQASLVAAMGEAVSQFAEKRARFLAQLQQDVILLAVAIARRLMGETASDEATASEAAVRAAEEALGCLRAETDVAIRTHPDDAGALELFVDVLAEQLRDGAHVRIVADANVDRGGALVETADSTVDASIKSRIDQIAGELAPNWRKRSRELSLEV